MSMLTPTATATLPRRRSEVPGTEAGRVLREAAAARRAADRAESRLLDLAVHLVHLWPVTEQTTVASWDVDGTLDAEDPGPVAGVGTPGVAERAVLELGAALGVSYRSALGLVADSLELAFRLPTLWDLVQAGRLQAWKARRVAQQTRALSPQAAAFVDRQAAVGGRHNRLPASLSGLVTQALNRFDPDVAEGLEDAALSHREVVFDFAGTQSLGTARVAAILDVPDALDLQAAVSGLARSMGRLGDSSPVGVRRARALGLLAQPQQVLELFGTPAADQTEPVRPAPVRSWNTTPGTLYVHVTAADLRADAEGTRSRGGTVERLGSASLELLADWLCRTSRLTIRPVLDPPRIVPVDQHDPPAAMREAVVLRDGHCVFPGCTVDARACDLDHIVRYVPPDEGGPPGQTSLANLACLCRRHHRLKTFTDWDYQRASADSYTWTSPYGTSWRTTTAPRH